MPVVVDLAKRRNRELQPRGQANQASSHESLLEDRLISSSRILERLETLSNAHDFTRLACARPTRGTIRSLHHSVQRGSVITRIRRAICLSYVKTLLLGVG